MQSLAWLAWGLQVRGHPGRRPLLWFIGLVNASMLLEVLDFPPLWQALDAHALWHLATVPATYLWYAFALADMRHAGAAAGAAAAGLPSVLKAD